MHTLGIFSRNRAMTLLGSTREGSDTVREKEE